MGSSKLTTMFYSRLRAQQPLNFKGHHNLFKTQIWPFYISAQSSSEANIATPLHGLIWCKSTPWVPPFLMRSLLTAILTLCFLEYTKISRAFCLCTSALLPETHRTFSEGIHPHSSSFIFRPPPHPWDHAWPPCAVLRAPLCHWKKVRTGYRQKTE